MVSFDVLNPSQTLLEPHFLEASAGTGKTFAIEHIVTRLLLDETLKASNKEILVVTFTRASTRELKVRIRESLCRVLKELKGDSLQIPYLALIKEDERKKQEAIDKLEEALTSFDQMQIFTIHGFCQQMLKEYPFEAGVNFSQGFAEDSKEKKIYEQHVLDFFRERLSPDLFDRAQIQKVLKKHRFDIQKVVAKIIRIIKQEGAIEKPVYYKEIREAFSELLDEFMEDHSLLKEEFLTIAPFFKGLSSVKKEIHPHFLEQIDFFIASLSCREKVQENLSNFLQHDDFFFDYFHEEALKKTVKFSFASLKEKFSFFSFVEKIKTLFSKAIDPAFVILSMAFECKKGMQHVLDYYGLTPPDSLLKVMKDKLGERAFLEKVKNRYKAALIDEFQDTDPVQWEIFRNLFVDERKSFPLFLVGDPKQSIYAFRNADLPTYLKAATYFLPHQRKSLDTNYRSEPKLIEALNALFSCSESWLCEQKELIYEKVRPSVLAKDTNFEDGRGSVHFFLADQGASREKAVPSKDVEEREFFPFIAEEIFKLKEKGLNYKNFAVLIRDRFQGERLERFFKKKEIPYVATTIIPIIETKAFGFFKLLIEVSGAPEDSSLLKQLLAHPMIGFSHKDLRSKEESEKFLFASSLIKEAADLYMREGFLVFWERFLQTTFDPSLLSFERQLLIHGNIQDYHDLLQVAELVIENHHRKIVSHEELFFFLEELERRDPEEDPSVRRKASTEEEGVHIMTIHKSKGLEFNVVFALGVCVRSAGVQEVIKMQEGEDFSFTVFDVQNKQHQKVIEKENKEKMRQLYVALTRARQRVYIPYCFALEKERTSLSSIELFCQKSFPLGVIQGLQSLSSYGVSFSENFQREHKESKEVELSRVELSSVSRFSKNFQEKIEYSYSSLAKHSYKEHVILERKEGGLPSSAEVGEIFHKILEKIFERGLYLLPNREGIYSLIDQEVGFSCLKGFEDSVYERIEAVLDSSFDLGGAPFSFKKLPLAQVTTEMEFVLQQEEKCIKGVIDLFFIHNNKYYIVDWKTNFLGEGEEHYSRSSLEKCMEEYDYFLQASLYTQAVKLFLKKKNIKEESFGGMLYVFIRGLSKNPSSSSGLYLI